MFTSSHIKAVVAATALSLVPASINGVAAQTTDDLLQMLQEQAKQIEALQDQLNALKEVSAKTEAAPKAAKPDFKMKWEPAPSIKSADGRFEMNLRGRIYADGGWVSDGNDTLNLKATEFRTARLGIEGKAWKDVKYKFETDFAGNKVTIKDAYIEWSSAAKVKFALGQFKTPNSLEEQTSSRYITLMERASFTDAFSFSRQMGIRAAFGGDNWTATLGAFRGGAGVKNDDEGTTFAGRFTYGPKVGEIQTHIGASVRHRKAGDDQSLFRYRQRPHSHMSDRFIDTGKIADQDFFYGFEAAAVRGPLSVQGEFGWLKADVGAATPDPVFAGGYVSLSWFLTGESHAYSAKKGSFGRVKVNNPVFEGGMGAWQVTARFDTVDLTESFHLGGKQDTYILGVNWYLNRHTRLLINYSHSEIKRGFLVSANGLDGTNDVDALGIRAQVDW